MELEDNENIPQLTSEISQITGKLEEGINCNLYKENNQLRYQNEILKNKINENQKKINDLTTAYYKYKNNCEKLLKIFENKSKNPENKDLREIKKLQNIINEKNKEIDKYKNELTNLKNNYDSYKNNNSKILKENEELKKTISELKNKVNNLQLICFNNQEELRKYKNDCIKREVLNINCNKDVNFINNSYNSKQSRNSVFQDFQNLDFSAKQDEEINEKYQKMKEYLNNLYDEPEK